MLLIATPSTTFALQYHYDCTTAQLSQFIVIRGAALGFSGSDFTGSIGDAAVENLLPCSNPVTNYDEPAILAANLQSSASKFDIVQIGFMECGAPGSSSCGNVPSDGAEHFVYICSDISGGLPCLADGWAGTPVLGRRYRFRVQYNELGTGKWDYSIKDLTTGITKRPAAGVTSHWHNGDGAWWGGETHDYGSTMGPQDVTGDVNMNYMQYWRPSVGAWSVVTNIDIDVDLVRLQGSPLWYHAPISSHAYTNDQVNWYTVAH